MSAAVAGKGGDGGGGGKDPRKPSVPVASHYVERTEEQKDRLRAENNRRNSAVTVSFVVFCTGL